MLLPTNDKTLSNGSNRSPMTLTHILWRRIVECITEPNKTVLETSKAYSIQTPIAGSLDPLPTRRNNG